MRLDAPSGPPHHAAMRSALMALLVIASAVVAGCGPSHTAADWARVSDRTPPFLAGTYAADASVASDASGRVALTWVTRDSLGATDLWLSVSVDSGVTFSLPLRANSRAGKVASYPESRPVASFGPGGHLLLVWASARDEGEYASDVVTRLSLDEGRSLGPERMVNDDAGDPRSTYHGFAATDWLSDGRPVVAWIDGRSHPLAEGEEEPHTAEIYADVSADGGASWAADTRVAGLVCPCCRIALRARGEGDVAVAYRGAGDDLRDPRLAFSRDGGLSFRADSLVSRDGWKLDGCPSVGPVLTAGDSELGGTFAWFTGADEVAGVHTVAWRAVGDSAFRFEGALSHADSLREPTRPMLVALGRQALLGVLGKPPGEGGARVLALRTLGGGAGPSRWLRLGTGVRSAALAAASAGSAWAAWTEDAGDGPRVRLVRVEPRRD